MTPRITAYLCTFPIEPLDDSITESHACGRIARATYERSNKRARDRHEIYDRCARHDSAKVQADATRQGFERIEL